jgi:hypothetical protein
VVGFPSLVYAPPIPLPSSRHSSIAVIRMIAVAASCVKRQQPSWLQQEVIEFIRLALLALEFAR